MPYNSSAIPPTQEIAGAATLPLARVKRILAVDEELGSVSANASFAITIATEMFIRYFADQAMNVIKSEKKPRRQIHYGDLANAVSRVDNLSFLEDIVPKTTTVREFKSRRARAVAQEKSGSLQNGQTTLDGSSKLATQRPQSQSGPPPPFLESMDVGPTGDLTANDPQRQPIEAPHTNGQQITFEHWEPVGPVPRDNAEDVDMS